MYSYLFFSSKGISQAVIVSSPRPSRRKRQNRSHREIQSFGNDTFYFERQREKSHLWWFGQVFIMLRIIFGSDVFLYKLHSHHCVFLFFQVIVMKRMMTWWEGIGMNTGGWYSNRLLWKILLIMRRSTKVITIKSVLLKGIETDLYCTGLS